ncbi:uncharacterized protein LOC110462391 [Mizuhopecten yessoensis]|uniref:Uncharacterized protein n=1 Tax=Mizuhopecten yessoensis TaxID=6573 RepID=A0A210PY89_MIZYE|nr:uncharacterized protein LOC110462391 [Mizuhopecten yessoensis]OWF41445.1 hypothetical protein KP79_PYT07925 [Mizuhopecten yessoensis]
MEEMYIPDTKQLSFVTKETVDRFASWAEALSLPVEGRKIGANALRMAVARQILIKLSRQKTDVNRLFDALGRIVLTVASGCLKCPVRLSDASLPNLPRPQRQALKEFVTFHTHYVQRLNRKVRLLSNTIVQHRRSLETLGDVQKRSQTIRRLIEDMKQALETKEAELRELNKRCGSRGVSCDELVAKNEDVRLLQRRIKRKKTLMDGALIQTDRENATTKEKRLREKLQMVYDDVLRDTKYEIIDRLTYGMRCIRQIVTRLPPDLQKRTLRIVNSLDLEVTAESLLKVSSKIYVFPDLEQSLEFHNGEVPQGKILNPNEGQLISEEDLWEKLAVSLANSLMCGPSSPGDQTVDSDMGYCSSTGRNSTGGYTQRPPMKRYVRVTHPSQIDIPGFLYLNTGMKIKQKVYYEEQEIAFGWYRPHNLAAKSWGFYLTRLTAPASFSNDDHTTTI